jgi:hypothetical protein
MPIVVMATSAAHSQQRHRNCHPLQLPLYRRLFPLLRKRQRGEGDEWHTIWCAYTRVPGTAQSSS